ncbi:transcription elongation factor S-II [Sarotherodon galilaeus]
MKVSATLSSAKVPPSNLTLQEKKAVASLSKDHNITILPADKGRCTVVLNTTDYHTKITTLLSDNNTYEALKRDPTSSYKKKVIACLQDLEKDKIIDRLKYHRLYPGDAIPCIYGLPKIHKEGVPLRPIVSSINSATYNIAKHLATILAPLVGNTPHHIKNSTDFTDKVQKLTLDPDETMVSFDVVSLFTCIPTTEAVETVRKRLQEDSSLEDRTNFTPDQICTLLDLCLTTTYFKYNEGFYRQKHGCAMGSPVSPIVANLYMEEVERKALGSFKGRVPSHWYRYVDDTWVKIKTQEVESFTAHINAVDKNIKFTREDTKDNCLPFLDCAVHIEENGNLNIEVYRKPTHTDQYLLFDSHHPLEHKLGVIRTLHHRAEHVPSKPEGKKKEHTHVKEALKTCGYPNWAFIKSAKRHRKEDQTPAREDKKDRRNNIVIPYVAGVSEKLRRVFSKHDIPVYFRPSNTLRHKLVHPKDKTPKHRLNNVVYAVQCSEECPDLYIGETKQPLHKRMAQHRRATSTGQDSAVHLHLKDKGHSFEDANVHILDREDRWFERGVKEAIYVHCERPSLNRGGGLRHQLSAIYNPVLSSLPRRLNAHSHPGPSDLRKSHDRVGPGFTMNSPETLAD